ncbi:hypothetical protein OEZ85_004070 [Tetradesmus obliquus]|uniref:TFIIS N-terminal domain-containing protein n=1 Tax=Tetradesmus obliquus TaxID=3088 RepID=A0ABY8UH19_TETOB|nr:hypothetical protein OEZ85_004070 [Tetradesmus obliquus]
MMKQLQGMRARLSHLPDDERRSAAADMALKLASMWGLGDEGSEDEDEGGAAAARADGQQQLDVSAAADMALKLASMWGLGEEGSDDDEEAAAARADGQQQLDVKSI